LNAVFVANEYSVAKIGDINQIFYFHFYYIIEIKRIRIINTAAILKKQPIKPITNLTIILKTSQATNTKPIISVEIPKGKQA
jgi:hypothetical protein